MVKKANTLLLLTAILIVGCVEQKREVSITKELVKSNRMKNKIIASWNLLPEIIKDSSNSVEFNIYKIGKNEDGRIVSLSEDDIFDYSCDTIQMGIHAESDLTQQDMWLLSYKGDELECFLGSSMGNLSSQENSIRVYQKDKNFLNDISQKVIPIKSIIAKLDTSKELDTLINSPFPSMIYLIIIHNKDNSLKVRLNGGSIKKDLGIDVSEDSKYLTLLWSSNDGYLLQ